MSMCMDTCAGVFLHFISLSKRRTNIWISNISSPSPTLQERLSTTTEPVKTASHCCHLAFTQSALLYVRAHPSWRNLQTWSLNKHKAAGQMFDRTLMSAGWLQCKRTSREWNVSRMVCKHSNQQNIFTKFYLPYRNWDWKCVYEVAFYGGLAPSCGCADVLLPKWTLTESEVIRGLWFPQSCRSQFRLIIENIINRRQL